MAVVVFLLIAWFYNSNRLSKESTRAEEIRNDIKKEAEEYINIFAPLKNNKGKEIWLSDEEITDPLKRGASKELLLQNNKKDYCKAVIHGKATKEKWDVSVYLKCYVKVLFRTFILVDKEYENNLEYYKCIVLTPDKKQTTNKDFTCPSDKKEYILKNDISYKYWQ